MVNKLALAAFLLLSAGVVARQAAESVGAVGDVGEMSIEEELAGMANAITDAFNIDEQQAAANVAAFLRMIRVAEGTADEAGYLRIVGGGNADSFEDHPRILRSGTFRNGKAWKSTAAGAYQFLERTWDDLVRRIGLVDFSPDSQDAAAVELIRQRGALGDVRAGRFDIAIRKVATIWASLPGSPYGQPTITAEAARDLIAQNGGVFA